MSTKPAAGQSVGAYAVQSNTLPATLTSQRPCLICLNSDGNQVHHAREMLYGLRTSFTYLECGMCGCLQLTDPPEDLISLYPDDYYSFRQPASTNWWGSMIWEFLKRKRGGAYFGNPSLLGKYLKEKFPRPELDAISRTAVGKHSRILDVGCGSGALLRELSALGFRSLTGVDLFCPGNTCSTGINLRKGDIEDLYGSTWDLIMFHHSFEHMSNPLRALMMARSILEQDGDCVIRIPVVGWAWKHYGANWVQLDAPRHFFLHTEQSMRYLANQARLEVQRIEYDSTEFQFWGSELYVQDINRNSIGKRRWQEMFDPKQVRAFRERADELNSQRLGDQAVFYLRHVSKNRER